MGLTAFNRMSPNGLARMALVTPIAATPAVVKAAGAEGAQRPTIVGMSNGSSCALHSPSTRL